MPAAFEDFGTKANDLFNDGHDAGALKGSKTGAFGNGSYNLEFSRDVGTADLATAFSVEADGVKMEIGKDQVDCSFGCDVKQVEGLSLSFNPSFHTENGVGFGDLAANFQNKNLNANFKSSLTSTPLLSFNATYGCSAVTAGFTGQFDSKTGSLENLGWGFQKDGNHTLSFVSENAYKPFQGTLSLYKSMESGPFSCYGVQADTASHKLAVSWASQCCKMTTKYKIDQDGMFSVAQNKQVNGGLQLNLSAAFNTKDLSSGHKFGVGLAFN